MDGKRKKKNDLTRTKWTRGGLGTGELGERQAGAQAKIKIKVNCFSRVHEARKDGQQRKEGPGKAKQS